MLSQPLTHKFDTYKDIFVQLKDTLKWKVSDQRTLMMVASMYVVNKKPFDLKRFTELSEYIKDSVGMFSTLKSHLRFTVAAMLDIRFEDPKDKYNEFIDLYEKLVAGGFQRSTFTYISALIILTQDPIGSDHTSSIERSLDIYKGMKDKHYFLTSYSDYPLAVLLAERDGSIDELMDHVEYFYDKLHEGPFYKGNDLQFLSHILSLNREENADILIDRCITMFDAFKQHGISRKMMFYPMMGLLSMLENGSGELKNVLEMKAHLDSDKLFKWQKDMNFIMAVNFIMSDKLENSSLLETGIFTTIEAIIQAQQAAMIAAISASAAASSNGGG